MTTAPAHPARQDPYKNFKFRLLWNGRYVAGIDKVSGLRRSTEVVKHRPGGDPSTVRKSPAPGRNDPIMLEVGVTHDLEFQAWASEAVRHGASPGTGAPPNGLRADIGIERVDDAGHPLTGYRIRDCWISAYQALAAIDAQANAVAIGLIRLENAGWERDGPAVDEEWLPA